MSDVWWNEVSGRCEQSKLGRPGRDSSVWAGWGFWAGPGISLCAAQPITHFCYILCVEFWKRGGTWDCPSVYTYSLGIRFLLLLVYCNQGNRGFIFGVMSFETYCWPSLSCPSFRQNILEEFWFYGEGGGTKIHVNPPPTQLCRFLDACIFCNFLSLVMIFSKSSFTHTHRNNSQREI